MSFWVFVGEVTLLFVLGFFFIFTVDNFLLKEHRAFRRALQLFLMFFLGNILLFTIPGVLKNLLFLGIFLLGIGAFVFIYFAQAPHEEMKVIGEQKRIDERDTIFSRFDLKERSKAYKDYYERKSGLRNTDEEIRKFPEILSPEHIKKNPILFTLTAAETDFTRLHVRYVTGEVSPDKIELSPFDNTRHIKNILKFFGADTSGVCELDQAYVYSHVGRGPEPYGSEIALAHKYAIVFAVPMDIPMIATSPKAPVIVETERKYVEVSKIALIVSDLIRRMGYPARAHISGSNYQAILPPLGWKAGIGEIGRIGILITEKYGPRVRLGLITTDLPLTPDSPKKNGIQDFCNICKKCAINCPAQAIPHGNKVEENGVLKWVINREGCYRFWRKAGTDCAMCLYVCPYSKPNNSFHTFIRNTISRTLTAQKVALRADDYFYGKNPLPREPIF
ncbi:MAG: reductive dehalogenase [Candidatus Aminicenantes bacterium]|nr:reductive dehalogenase [Candidatus Aminicenantes bacterium]